MEGMMLRVEWGEQFALINPGKLIVFLKRLEGHASAGFWN
jgi:hypothetical protein